MTEVEELHLSALPRLLASLDLHLLFFLSWCSLLLPLLDYLHDLLFVFDHEENQILVLAYFLQQFLNIEGIVN